MNEMMNTGNSGGRAEVSQTIVTIIKSTLRTIKIRSSQALKHPLQWYKDIKYQLLLMNSAGRNFCQNKGNSSHPGTSACKPYLVEG